KIVYALAKIGNTPTFFPTNTSSIRYFINHSNKTATSGLIAINAPASAACQYIASGKRFSNAVYLPENLWVLKLCKFADGDRDGGRHALRENYQDRYLAIPPLSIRHWPHCLR